jgi:hypothetical protein
MEIMDSSIRSLNFEAKEVDAQALAKALELVGSIRAPASKGTEEALLCQPKFGKDLHANITAVAKCLGLVPEKDTIVDAVKVIVQDLAKYRSTILEIEQSRAPLLEEVAQVKFEAERAQRAEALALSLVEDLQGGKAHLEQEKEDLIKQIAGLTAENEQAERAQQSLVSDLEGVRTAKAKLEEAQVAHLEEISELAAQSDQGQEAVKALEEEKQVALTQLQAQLEESSATTLSEERQRLEESKAQAITELTDSYEQKLSEALAAQKFELESAHEETAKTLVDTHQKELDDRIRSYHSELEGSYAEREDAIREEFTAEAQGLRLAHAQVLGEIEESMLEELARVVSSAEESLASLRTMKEEALLGGDEDAQNEPRLLEMEKRKLNEAAEIEQHQKAMELERQKMELEREKFEEERIQNKHRREQEAMQAELERDERRMAAEATVKNNEAMSNLLAVLATQQGELV